jgi:hypothetical protein
MAARVRDHSARTFGDRNVFMDFDNLMAGLRFDKELEKALSEPDVFPCVIGSPNRPYLTGELKESPIAYDSLKFLTALAYWEADGPLEARRVSASSKAVMQAGHICRSRATTVEMGQVYVSQASLLDGASTPESSKSGNGGGTRQVSTRFPPASAP